MAILHNHAKSDWDRGRYHIERACTCRRGNRSAECASGWHVNTTSDDRADALEGARVLAPHGTHRIVDSHTGQVIA